MMNEIRIDDEIVLVPYYPCEDVTLAWYRDKDVCKQVDNIDHVYSLEMLRAMYTYLSTHGACYYICYQGQLVGDVTLRDNHEVCIVICKAYQNRHIGRRCIATMIDLAREQGLDEVTAQIYAFNKQSRRMFLSVGFEQTADEWYAYDLYTHDRHTPATGDAP